MINPLLDQERAELIAARHKTGAVEVAAWPRPEKLLEQTDLDTTWVRFSTLNHRTRAEQEAALAKAKSKLLFSGNPLGPAAQEAQYEILTSQNGFKELLDDLRVRGQQEPAIVTADGVLINGNRRAAALRYLFEHEDHKDARYVKCLVLPSDATTDELVDLETELQIARDFKESYSWVNEALLIADIYERENRSFDRVASRMHRDVSSVRSKYRNLQYVNELISLSSGVRQYVDFHDNESAFTELAKHLQGVSGPEVEDIKNAYFLGILSGTQYRRLRHLQRSNAGELILAEIENDPTLKLALEASDTGREAADHDPLDDLLGDPAPRSKLTPLVSLVASQENDSSLALPSGQAVEVRDLLETLQSAIQAAAAEAEEDTKDRSALMAPLDRLERAIAEFDRAMISLPKARAMSDFDEDALNVKISTLAARIQDYYGRLE